MSNVSENEPQQNCKQILFDHQNSPSIKMVDAPISIDDQLYLQNLGTYEWVWDESQSVNFKTQELECLVEKMKLARQQQETKIKTFIGESKPLRRKESAETNGNSSPLKNKKIKKLTKNIQ